MGACNNRHTPTFTHLEPEFEGLDLDDLDLGEYEGPHDPSGPVFYTVSLLIAKDVENETLASVLRSFPGTYPQLFYRPARLSKLSGPLRERAQRRLPEDLASVLKGVVPPNTTRGTATPI